MGCWNETCMVSRLPIYAGDPIDFILLAGRNPRLDSCYSDGVFAPVAPPVRGEYDDYGNIERADCSGLAPKLLRACKFFARKEGANIRTYEYVPLEPDGETGPGDPATDDESFVRALIRSVQVDDVFLEDYDPVHGRVMLPVHTAFIHRRFAETALRDRSDMGFYLPVEQDVSYRTRQVGAMRHYLRYAEYDASGMGDLRPDGCPKADEDGLAEITDLRRLHFWLDAMRVAWAPSTGTGSQGITDDDVVAFHKAIYDMAVEQRHIWDE